LPERKTVSDVKREWAGGHLKLIFSGPMDGRSLPEVEAKVREAMTPGAETVTFDMEEVPYVNSGFLRLCLQMGKLHPEKFRMLKLQPPVKGIVKLAGMDAFIGH
jgi:anti-anti-sigma factor